MNFYYQVPVVYAPAVQQVQHFAPPQAQLATIKHTGSSFRVFHGQDASTFQRLKGLTNDKYCCGDIVSVSRSNGSKTVGEISSLTNTGMVVNMGNSSKVVLIGLVPSHVGKLVGAHF